MFLKKNYPLSMMYNHVLEALFHISILLRMENRTAIHGSVLGLLKTHQFPKYFYHWTYQGA